MPTRAATRTSRVAGCPISSSEQGFDGELLDRVVDTVCRNKDAWVSIMMAEEHALTDVDRRASLRSSAIIGASAIGASVAPVLPFAFARGPFAMATSPSVAVVLLFGLGALKARVTTGSPGRSGLAMTAIGLASALAAYAVASWIVGHT